MNSTDKSKLLSAFCDGFSELYKRVMKLTPSKSVSCEYFRKIRKYFNDIFPYFTYMGLDFEHLAAYFKHSCVHSNDLEACLEILPHI